MSVRLRAVRAFRVVPASGAESGRHRARPPRRHAVGLACLLAIAGALGTPWGDSFLFSIGVIVALVSEALLPTVTLTLAWGAEQMAKRKVLVRHLEAVETLGSTTCICTDKTGTLTRNEMTVLEQHIALAVQHDQLILVHTPHLEDKLKGTNLILDLLSSHRGVRPERVIIDHVEEHTIKRVLDQGFWAGITLYPDSKSSPPRAVDMIEMCGRDRIWMNSAWRSPGSRMIV